MKVIEGAVPVHQHGILGKVTLLPGDVDGIYHVGLTVLGSYIDGNPVHADDKITVAVDEDGRKDVGGSSPDIDLGHDSFNHSFVLGYMRIEIRSKRHGSQFQEGQRRITRYRLVYDQGHSALDNVLDCLLFDVDKAFCALDGKISSITCRRKDTEIQRVDNDRFFRTESIYLVIGTRAVSEARKAVDGGYGDRILCLCRCIDEVRKHLGFHEPVESGLIGIELHDYGAEGYDVGEMVNGYVDPDKVSLTDDGLLTFRVKNDLIRSRDRPSGEGQCGSDQQR